MRTKPRVVFVAAFSVAASLAVGVALADYRGYDHLLWDVEIARNLVEHGSFSQQRFGGGHPGPTAEPVPTLFREPAYPLWLAAIMKTSPILSWNLVVAQALLHAATTCLTFSVALRILQLRLALAVTVLTALDPTLLSLTVRPQAENLSVFTFTLAAWVLTRFYPVSTPKHAAALGLALGLASLSRFQAMGMSLILLFYLTLMPWRTYGKKRLTRLAGSMLLFWALAVSPWVLRNWMVFGRPQIAPSRLMWTLCEKASILRGDFTYGDILPYAVSLYSTRIAGRLFPGWDAYLDQKSPDRCGDLRHTALSQAHGELEDEQATASATWRLIREHPAEFALVTLVSPISYLNFEIEALPPVRAGVKPLVGPTAEFAVKIALRLYSALILAACAMGVVRMFRTKDSRAGVLSFLVVTFVAGHAVTRIHTYFIVSILPLLLMLAVRGVSPKTKWRTESLPESLS